MLPSRFSRVRLCATQWAAAYQASPSMGFSKQEHWSGLPLPSPGDLPDPEIEPGSPALEGDALTSEPRGKPVMTTIAIYYAPSMRQELSVSHVTLKKYPGQNVILRQHFSRGVLGPPTSKSSRDFVKCKDSYF